jgi:hypothetical protein
MPFKTIKNFRSPLDPAHPDQVSADGHTAIVGWDMKGSDTVAQKNIGASALRAAAELVPQLVLGLADDLEALGLEERPRICAEARVVVDDQNVHVGSIVADGRRGDHTGNRTMQKADAAGQPQEAAAVAAGSAGIVVAQHPGLTERETAVSMRLCRSPPNQSEASPGHPS